MKTSSWRRMGVALCALGLSCGGPGGAVDPASSQVRTNVVLIGIDTLRRDYLSCYGFPHPISPRIDELAGEGAIFTHAVSTAPWTLPAFASILSGQYPSSHGAGRRTGPQGKGGEPPKAPLRRRVTTVLEILRRRGGFETAVFFDNPYLGDTWGMAQRFDVARQSQGGGAESVGQALRWLAERHDRRTFLFLHLMEPHLPYEPPEPYASRARDWFPEEGERFEKGDKIRALYAGEVAYADALVGRLVDGLAELGLLDRTLLILTSDHGEEFYEHEPVERRFYHDPREIWGIGHGHSQFEELLAVPLIVRYPPAVAAGTKVDALVQGLDLAPSILDWEGLGVPQGMTGVSFLPTLGGATSRDYGYSEFMLYGDDRRSYREGRWKLILGPDPETAQLYDLEADPGEIVNLAHQRPELFKRLARGLLRTERDAVELGKSQAGATEAVTIDEATRQELRALGYLQ